MIPPDALTVEPVRWRRPTGPLLLDQVYPTGRPPFDPFPNVTQILKGYCPVAIHWDQLWGRTWPGRVDTGLTDPVGQLYHEIAGEYRLLVAWNLEPWDPTWDRAIIRARLQDYWSRWTHQRGVAITTGQRLWELFSRLLTRQHLEGELARIRGARLLAEVDFVNPRCPFDFGERRVHYPIRGRIDEIDLSRNLIIERTLETDPLTGGPPGYKPYQAWLCAWAIANLEEHLRPHELRSVWSRPITIRLETPDRDVDVPLDNRYLPWVAQAYYWIQALFRNRGQPATAAYQNALCSIDQPDDSCMHCRIDCFTKRPAYPQQRQEIGRICSQLARALLYDRVWDEDLWHYKQALLPEEYHLQERTRHRLTVDDVDGDTFRVQLPETGERLRLSGTMLAVPSPLGNLAFGKRLRLTMTDVRRRVATFRASHTSVPRVQAGDIIEVWTDVPESTLLMFREPLGHLKDQQRQRLAKVRRVGADSLIRAQQSPLTNTLRAIVREETFEGP